MLVLKMKSLFKENRIVLSSIFLLASIAGAILIMNGEPTVQHHTSGLQGGTAEGETYSARFFLTASDKPGGGLNTLGGNYTANIGFFNSTVTGDVYSTVDAHTSLTQGWNLISISVEI